MPFDVPFSQWLFARKTFINNKYDPSEAKLTQFQQNLIKKAINAQDNKKELALTEKQKEKMYKAFEKLYNYFRNKKINLQRINLQRINSTKNIDKIKKEQAYRNKETLWFSRQLKRGNISLLSKKIC